MLKIRNWAARGAAQGSGLVMGLALPAMARASTGGGTLPWESPLQSLQQSLTGPVAGAISVIALAITGGMLVFGGELSDFARRMIMVVMGISVLVGGSSLITALWPSASGALLP